MKVTKEYIEKLIKEETAKLFSEQGRGILQKAAAASARKKIGALGGGPMRKDPITGLLPPRSMKELVNRLIILEQSMENVLNRVVPNRSAESERLGFKDNEKQAAPSGASQDPSQDLTDAERLAKMNPRTNAIN